MKKLLSILLCVCAAVSLQAQKKVTAKPQNKIVSTDEIVEFSVGLLDSDKWLFETAVETGWTVTTLETPKKQTVFRLKKSDALIYSFKVKKVLEHHDNSTMTDYEETFDLDCYEERSKKDVGVFFGVRNGIKIIMFEQGGVMYRFGYVSTENADVVRKAYKDLYNNQK